MYCKICIHYASWETCLHHFLFTCPGAFIVRISTCSFPCDTCMSLIGSHVLLCNRLVIIDPWRSRPFILVSCTFPTLFKVLYLIFESYVNRSIDNLSPCTIFWMDCPKQNKPQTNQTTKKTAKTAESFLIAITAEGGSWLAHIYCFL